MEMIAREIRPQFRNEKQFGIGSLPQQEIRQPFLARCPYQKVRVGDARRVERLVESPGVDIGRLDLASRHLLRKAPCRPGNLVAGAIVERDDKGEAGIVAGRSVASSPLALRDFT